MPFTADCDTLRCMDFGTDDLGRAALFCDGHKMTVVTAPAPIIPEFMKGWEACQKVWTRWLETETAKEQARALAEEQKEKDFVNAVAEGLK